jgi:type VII secretion protein EccB
VQSRKDQVEAQTYLLSRLTGALVSADPDAMEPPTRRDRRAVLAGLLVGLLVAGGFAGFALLSAKGSTLWRQPGTLILDKASGSRYLLQNGALRPVLNLASARLLAGGNLKTASVKSATLKDVPRGDPIGIAGAPDSLPQPALLNTGVWRVCAATPGTAPATLPTVELITEIGATAAGTRPGTGDGLLVSNGGQTYLLWQSQAFTLARPWVIDVLGWGGATPVPVASSWLELLPRGPDLVPVPVPGRGAKGLRIDDASTKVGQFFRAEAVAGGTGGAYYLLQKDGLSVLTTTEYLLTSAENPGGRVRGISNAALARARKAPRSSSGSALPSTPPRAQPAEPGRSPCVEYPGARTVDRPELVWAALPAGAHPAPSTPAEASPRLAPDRAVTVRPGGGALITVPPVTEGQDPALLLVNDSGTVYPLSGDSAAEALGYEPDSAAVLPPGYLRLLPSGPLLSASGLR